MVTPRSGFSLPNPTRDIPCQISDSDQAHRYWEQVLALLWPRFELILEMNVQSVRSTDPQRLGGLDTRPHYVSMGRGGGVC